MRIDLRTAALIAPLVLTLSCGKPVSEDAAPASLRVGVPAPVLRSTGIVGLGFHRVALTQETLLVIGADGRPVPRILASWQAEPGGMVWRFAVRKGARFHDGTAVTADALAGPVRAELLRSSSNAVMEVVAENAETLVITLREPYAFLFEDISLITARRVVDKATFHTGPYRVVGESAERLQLKAVDNHYRGEPAIEHVEVAIYPDQRNAWSALMRDEIDMLYDVSRESLDFVRSESSISVSTFPRPYVYLFGFNVSHANLRDPRVRRALNLAIDRDSLIESGLAGEGESASGHIWPGHWAYDPAASGAAYDPRQAMYLLEEAGYGVRHEPGRMPARLRLTCLVYEPLRELALGLQRQLAAVDIDLELQVVPTGELITRLTVGDFDSFVFEMASARTFKFPYQFWHSRAPLLKHGYAAADAEFDALRSASNDEEFRARASALQRRFAENPPAAFLAWGRTSRAVSRRFEVPETGEDVYHTISRWKPAAKSN